MGKVNPSLMEPLGESRLKEGQSGCDQLVATVSGEIGRWIFK